MKLRILITTITLILIGAAFGCTMPTNNQGQTAANASNGGPATGGKKVKIGFSMATLREERWQRDKAAFEESCKALDVECVITVADTDSDRQANDIDNLLTQGIDVLVIAPQNATQAATSVDKAKAQGIPVVSYDRLVDSDKIDLYISHQVPVIGQKIAEYALQNVPKGKYIMVYGSKTDNNALIWQRTEMAVLQPSIDKKEIEIVADQFIPDWKPELALNFVENALTRNNDDIQAIVVSNDGMAGGAIEALTKRGLAGKILVTGQDAQLDALQRIAEGKQSMTIYKAIAPLAERPSNRQNCSPQARNLRPRLL